MPDSHSKPSRTENDLQSDSQEKQDRASQKLLLCAGKDAGIHAAALSDFRKAVATAPDIRTAFSAAPRRLPRSRPSRLLPRPD